MKTVKEIVIHKEDKVKKKLAVYCRVSSNSEDQRHSFLSQIKYYSKYVKTHNQYELVDIYADEGITGTEMKNRNEFNRMIMDCKKGKIDCIITKSVSRFARNLNDMLTVVRMLKELGINVIFEEQGIDTAKINSEMIVAFPGLAAQQESINISENVRWSNTKRMESGEFKHTCLPFGFKKENDEVIINEEEAKVVKDIFRLYIKGYGKTNIANIISDKYSYIKISGSWTRSKINYILNNEKYMGDAILQKKYTTESFPKRQIINRGEVPRYYVEDYNPAIISKETFEKAMELQKKRNKGPMLSAEHILTGLLRCSDCGGLYRKMYSNNVPYWLCSGKASSQKNCKTHMIKEKDILLTFQAMIFKLKCNDNKLVKDLINNIKILNEKASIDKNEIEQINKKIVDYSIKAHMISRLRARGVLKDSEYIAQNSVIEDEINKLRSKYKSITADNRYLKLIRELNKLNDCLYEYQNGSDLTKEFVNRIIEKVVIDNNDNMTIRLIGNLEINESLLKEY